MSGPGGRGNAATIRVAGGYALATGLDLAARTDLYAAVLDLPTVDGLEVSVGAPTWPEDRVALLRAVSGRTRPVPVVVTTVGLAAALAPGGAGIASPGQDERRAAVRALRAAADEVGELADRGLSIAAVAVHSFPSVDPADASTAGLALQRSLVELAVCEWGGASLVLEHCDARSAASMGSKGLLPLGAELDAVGAAADESGTDIGVSLNTGRSAIEGRGAAAVAEHVRAVEQAGFLRGVIVSGAAEAASAYGPAWTDVHPPLRDQLPESALSPEQVRAVLETIAPPLRFDGAKVSPASTDAGLVERLRLIRSVLEALPSRGESKR